MSEGTGDNAERMVNMQHNAEKIQCNTPLVCVFIDLSNMYPGLCEKAIRLVNNGSLY